MALGMDRNRIRKYIILHLFLMIYSMSGIVSKYASNQDFFSVTFFLLYALEIIILVFYAIGWQQFIKRMPLTALYANKAITVVWGCIWGILIFSEKLTVGKFIGAVLVLAGVSLFGYADGRVDNNG